MRRVGVLTVALALTSLAASAVKITLFSDTDTFIERAREIIIAQCVSLPQEEGRESDLQPAEVNILRVLKGSRTSGDCRVATLYPMQPGTTYMLYSLGGSVLGTDFLALPELSVVPLPSTLNIHELEGKDLKEQVHYIFSRRLFELERQLAPLLEEKELLQKAVSDRPYEWYECNGPVKTRPIAEGRTQTGETHLIWLDVEGRKLQWSHSSPGKSGFFYFEKMGVSWTPYWESSPCDVNRIEDLVGKPLKARFYGMYTPGRADTALGSTGGLQAIDVNVGQVLLARTVDDPNKILIIQVMAQKQDEEQMSARYAFIEN